MLTWNMVKDLALKIGHRPDAIRKWKERQHIPYRVRGKFIDAQRQGEKPQFSDFDHIAWPDTVKRTKNPIKRLERKIEALEAQLRKFTPP
jgi:hypothetical protein